MQTILTNNLNSWKKPISQCSTPGASSFSSIGPFNDTQSITSNFTTNKSGIEVLMFKFSLAAKISTQTTQNQN